MIPFRNIRSAVVKSSSADIGIKLIEMNNSGKAPPYPYITYDFTEMPDAAAGFAAVTFDGSHKTHTETVEFSISFQSYANSKDESIENAMRLRDWFLTTGHQLLKDTVNVIVVSAGPVQNRDVRIGDEWERRNGFDVDFRTVNFVITNEMPIETAEIKRG
ncbi:hypothetical protein HQN90_20370 [Paenibacillus alba]|uniref:phage neck terminator protein n=1 Tax=Paenibacillus alba TaxID=1197127 RepID=UPI00156794CC|nr:hypothetical protein [Paenibacillus alba]NQX68484.1 hypothetical protein [Paenibacillus alba]